MKKINVILIILLTCATFIAQAKAPKYVFYFIGDGMGLGHIMSTNLYYRQAHQSEEQLLMTTFPVASMAMTFSANSPITDSAAAGTALSTGHKTNNGMLGVTPDTVAVISIAKYLKDMGYGVGVATSVPIDDATPGAFYTHTASRKNFDAIAQDLANSGYEFFAGSTLRGNPETVGKVVEAGGYKIYHGLSAYRNSESVEGGKVLILNPKGVKTGHFGYTIDSLGVALKLPEVTKTAIEHLQATSPKKFFLMVEGGNIDWAAHANDPATVIKEIIAFDQSIAEAYKFYLKHKDETLIVVTADHDTGGFTVGHPSKGSNGGYFKYIDNQNASKERLMELCKTVINSGYVPQWSEVKDEIANSLGLFDVIKVSEQEEADLVESYKTVFVDRDQKEYKTLYNSFNGFVEKVYALLNNKIGAKWTTTSHSGNMVPVFAVGVGADEFKSLNNNIDLPRKIGKITGAKVD